jgi:hypothetical protein
MLVTNANEALMKQPASIQPDPVPGPDYDPMDAIVENLLNIESFLDCLSDHPNDANYLKTHLSGILGLRRTLSHEIDKLAAEPYEYPPLRLKKLHEENEKIFTYVEGVIGEMESGDEIKFKKCLKAAEEALSKFDNELTP